MLTHKQAQVLIEAYRQDPAEYSKWRGRGAPTTPIKRLVELGLVTACTISRSWWGDSYKTLRDIGRSAPDGVTVEVYVTPQGEDVARGLL